ncbi:hypothetical protein BBO99_00004641 [Phytophthora kernoviae]|uniref:Uncharacterized protein n=2 Tax=Phytophthora kernoviae TaxID=325452 RepID=A0A421F6X6_9STRA|nr:hypothetical protein G195_007150 [Phytophthora kernoviae 00238/432]KAG2521855.1 hypothetical protein JM16_006096 [Phytophthora kernoviae]KAG2523332.1 hypothetical protein JM18_005814 [Phytophthora kernoviae]RLN26659.1 hypothetical protein BBI17_004625 [Phytophthora kernoviae]RLN80256.1 hypothetical protein BBO99_00004641 [Phytophthora kernoviae]
MTDPNPGMTDRVLRDFELVLMTKHRFALADVVVCMQSTVQDFHEVESSLTVASASVLSYRDSDKRSADVLDRVSCQLERLVGITPMFLGEQELTMFMNALRDFGRLSESLETDISGDPSVAMAMTKLQIYEPLQSAKQLRFGIQTIETSMSTMLLPHFEICRTITTA